LTISSIRCSRSPEHKKGVNVSAATHGQIVRGTPRGLPSR
jgi:hypothetical protein